MPCGRAFKRKLCRHDDDQDEGGDDGSPADKCHRRSLESSDADRGWCPFDAPGPPDLPELPDDDAATVKTSPTPAAAARSDGAIERGALRASVLALSLGKLRACRQAAEPCLRRSVLIANTLRVVHAAPGGAAGEAGDDPEGRRSERAAHPDPEPEPLPFRSLTPPLTPSSVLEASDDALGGFGATAPLLDFADGGRCAGPADRDGEGAGPASSPPSCPPPGPCLTALLPAAAWGSRVAPSASAWADGPRPHDGGARLSGAELMAAAAAAAAAATEPSGFLCDLSLDGAFSDIDTSMYDFDPFSPAAAALHLQGGGDCAKPAAAAAAVAAAASEGGAVGDLGPGGLAGGAPPCKQDLNELDQIMQVLVGT